MPFGYNCQIILVKKAEVPIYVISRKPGQKIVIDGGITVEVLSITSGGRVKIGLSAPSDTVILRGELMPEDEAEELQAEVA